MIRSIALFLALAMVVSACQTGPLRKRKQEKGGTEALASESGLTASASKRFRDIPLPGNVKEDMERSFVYESRSLQIGRMVYTTRASVNDLAQFYIRECQKLSWKLESVLQADGAQLAFSKPGHRLWVSARDLNLPKPGARLIITLIPEEGFATTGGSTIGSSSL